MKTRLTTRQVVVAGMLGALVGVLGLTPLGMVPVPTPAGHATILHIPVIIAAILEGPVMGLMVGFFFGAVSWWRAVTTPANPVAQIIFSDPVTAFGPRMLIGPLAYAALVAARSHRVRPLLGIILGLAVADGFYRTAGPAIDNPALAVAGAAILGVGAGALALWLLRGGRSAPALAAVVGTATNTVGVLGLVVLRGILPLPVAATVGLVHGLPEVVVGVILTVLVYQGLTRVGISARQG